MIFNSISNSSYIYNNSTITFYDNFVLQCKYTSIQIAPLHINVDHYVNYKSKVQPRLERKLLQSPWMTSRLTVVVSNKSQLLYHRIIFIAIKSILPSRNRLLWRSFKQHGGLIYTYLNGNIYIWFPTQLRQVVVVDSGYNSSHEFPHCLIQWFITMSLFKNV